MPRTLHLTPHDLGRAPMLFPVVGSLLGLASAATLRLLTAGIGVPLLAAVGAVAFGAVVTGALHLDGLADTADGFGSPRSRAVTLRIMRDPSVGTYGVVALILVLATRIVALATLAERDAGLAFVVLAPVLSRWAILPLAFLWPYARPAGGLGATVVGHVRPIDLAGATLLAAPPVGLVGWNGAVCAAAVGTLALLSGTWSRRRLGGVTGDVLGANTELAELATLLIGVART